MAGFRRDCGYPCEYTPTIQDGPVFRWGDEAFEVSASRNGVMISGHSPPLDQFAMRRFSGLLAVAEAVHLQLRRGDRPEYLFFGSDRVEEAQWAASK